MTFVERIRSFGLKSSVEGTNTAADLPWDVVVTRWMTPDHQAITDFEASLESHALELGGRNDAWGTIAEPGQTSG